MISYRRMKGLMTSPLEGLLEEEIIQPKSIGPPDFIPIITNERNNEESASVSRLTPLDEDEQ
jgi:hypothetical protein